MAVVDSYRKDMAKPDLDPQKIAFYAERIQHWSNVADMTLFGRLDDEIIATELKRRK